MSGYFPILARFRRQEGPARGAKTKVINLMDRLTEMEAFATVVDQGGFTDAAKKMGISKSAVSKHVSSLEARLGARLLNRTTRRVSPTEIGLAY